MVAQKPYEDRSIGVGNQAESRVEIRVEPSARWVRAVVGGVAVADSKRVLTVAMGLPVYYFPSGDVQADLLESSDRDGVAPGPRSTVVLSPRVGDRLIEDAAWRFPAPPTGAPALGEHVAFYWDRLDHWYEEDDEVFVHARDVHHRVDVLNSSRHVRVLVGGQVVADSRRPRLLFETGLPTRYYLPPMDVRIDLPQPVRNRHPVPVQRSNRALRPRSRRPSLAGHRLELPLPHSRVSKDRKPDLLLRRAPAFA